jgi:hypothetical protein
MTKIDLAKEALKALDSAVSCLSGKDYDRHIKTLAKLSLELKKLESSQPKEPKDGVSNSRNTDFSRF